MMKNLGMFDSAGKCLVVYSGAGEPIPDPRVADSAEIPPGLGPKHVEFKGGKVQVKPGVDQ